MNTRESVNITSPDNKEEECAKFTITDVSVPFVITNTTSTDEECTFSAWIKATANSSITIEKTEIQVTAEWERHKVTFVEDDDVLKIYFNKTGTYYFYKSQLEIGNVMTDWSPSSEDADASIAELNAKIELTANEINQSITAIRNDISDLDSRTVEVEASIKTKVDESTMSAAIEQSVSTVRKTANEAKEGVESLTERMESAEASIKTKVDGSTLDSAIEAKVSVVRNDVSDLEDRTTQAEAKLELKVNASELISEINASADVIRLNGDRIVIDSTYFKVTDKGVITSTSGNIGGFTIKGSAIYKNTDSLDSEKAGVYLGTDGLKVVGEYGSAIHAYGHSEYIGKEGFSTTIWGQGIQLNAFRDSSGTYYNSLEFLTNEEIKGYIDQQGFFTAQNSSFILWDGSMAPKTIVSDSYIASKTRFYLPNGNAIKGMKAGYDVSVPTTADSNAIGFINSSDRAILGSETNSAPTEIRTPSDLYLKCNATTSDDSNAYAIKFFKANSASWFRPCIDGATNLGGTNYHWKNVYATNGTIQTSDANKKMDVNYLDNKYLELFDLLVPKTFRTIYGDRTHVGFIAQDVEEAMNTVGLTSEKFAGLCYDFDEEGEKHYALRYNELFMLCIAKLKQLETEWRNLNGN